MPSTRSETPATYPTTIKLLRQTVMTDYFYVYHLQDENALKTAPIPVYGVSDMKLLLWADWVNFPKAGFRLTLKYRKRKIGSAGGYVTVNKTAHINGYTIKALNEHIIMKDSFKLKLVVVGSIEVGKELAASRSLPRTQIIIPGRRRLVELEES